MTVFKQFRFGTCRFVLALALGSASFSVPAQAGFEWTPPPAVKRNAGPAVRAVPVPEVDIMPTAEPVAANAAPEEIQIDTTPFTALTAPAALQTEDREYAVAEGFGRDIPLALVMQQVVPAGYAYSFDPGINPGMRVSWDGGKPWNKVLQDAVAPFHLDVIVSGMTVWLRPAAEPAATPPAMAEMPPLADIAAMPEVKESVDQPRISRMKEIESMDYEKLEMTGDTAANTVSAPQELITDPAQLAAIGKDDAGYRPSYPRRIPLPLAASDVPPPSAGNADAAPQPISLQQPMAEKVTSVGMQEDNPFAETGPTPAPFAEPVKLPEPQMLSYERKADKMEEVVAAAPRGDAPAVLDPFEIRFWQAEKDVSLKDTLSTWATMSGVKLYWGAGSDYSLPKAIRMHGTFPDAVTAILSAYGDGGDRPLGRLHPNLPDGPSVLIIQSSGSEKAVN